MTKMDPDGHCSIACLCGCSGFEIRLLYFIFARGHVAQSEGRSYHICGRLRWQIMLAGTGRTPDYLIAQAALKQGSCQCGYRTCFRMLVAFSNGVALIVLPHWLSKISRSV